MTQMLVKLDWEDHLGPRWMNQDRLTSFLYSDCMTEERLLSIESLDFVDATPMERVKAEAFALNSKLDKLKKFRVSTVFLDLSREERGRLSRQFNLMTEYARVLDERIEVWT